MRGALRGALQTEVVSERLQGYRIGHESLWEQSGLDCLWSTKQVNA